jgi:uncharacterized protein (TIGR04222 family)
LIITPDFAARSPAATAALWDQLEALDLDAGAAFSFSKRLARDNGWAEPYARRVVLEYKKFVFLAATCGHPVTPSDEVDQAWHLHLVYTRSYWDEMCGEVLGFPLHHGPTKGGAAEGHKFRDWYGRTLQAYVAAFGALPPADIWPPAAVRFGEAAHFRRVNLRRQWLLPRPRWSLRLGGREWATVLAAAALVGCTARTPLNPLNWYGTEFLWLFWGLFGALALLTLWLQRQGLGPADAYLGPLPSTYELARLAERGQRLSVSAVASLVHAGKAELVDGRRIKRTDAAPPTEPYERAIWNLIIPAGWSDLDKVRDQAEGANIGALQALDRSLEAKGLLLPAAERQRLDRIPVLVAAGLGLFGVAKIAVGASRDRPVGLLLLSLAGLVAVVVLYRQVYGMWATRRGQGLLREMAPVVQQHQQAGPPFTAQTVALSVALFGVNELSALGLDALIPALRPPNTGSSADGGSGCGSDGGGGDGSGCGGCGGCGGGGD